MLHCSCSAAASSPPAARENGGAASAEAASRRRPAAAAVVNGGNATAGSGAASGLAGAGAGGTAGAGASGVAGGTGTAGAAGGAGASGVAGGAGAAGVTRAAGGAGAGGRGGAAGTGTGGTSARRTGRHGGWWRGGHRRRWARRCSRDRRRRRGGDARSLAGISGRGRRGRAHHRRARRRRLRDVAGHGLQRHAAGHAALRTFQRQRAAHDRLRRQRRVQHGPHGGQRLGPERQRLGHGSRASTSASNVTIAGQTAPGPVYIMGGGSSRAATTSSSATSRSRPATATRVLRRIRPSAADRRRLPRLVRLRRHRHQRHQRDDRSRQTIYATDETISLNELANNVTIQYSNISQGQNYPQADAEASGVATPATRWARCCRPGTNAKISVHHNLYAHQKGRLPRVGTEPTVTVAGVGAYNDFRNNVFYNWLGTAGSGASGQPSSNNFVGNFYLAGPGGDNPSGGISTAITNAAGGTSIFNGSIAPGRGLPLRQPQRHQQGRRRRATASR